MKEYNGSCFCGSVTFTVKGEAKGAGYCHCASCRTWAAAPVNAFTLWPPESVQITRGKDFIAEFHKAPKSLRKYCKKCGGHLMTDHPQWNLVDVYAGVIPTYPFQPGIHVNYQESVLRIKDGLPKMKDLPKDMGGSGQTIPE